MSTWAWLITKPEMVRGRAVSNGSVRRVRTVSTLPGKFSFPPLSMA